MKHMVELYAKDAARDLVAKVELLEMMPGLVSNIEVDFDTIEHRLGFFHDRVTHTEEVYRLSYDREESK